MERQAGKGGVIMTPENQMHVTNNPKKTIMADRRPIGWLSVFLWVLASVAGWGLILFLVLGMLVPLHDALFDVNKYSPFNAFM